MRWPIVLAGRWPASARNFPDTATPALVVAGGVAANRTIKATLQKLCAEAGFAFVAPPLKLCTDNAAMIAWAGIERLRAGIAEENAARFRAALALAAGQHLGADGRLRPARSKGMSGSNGERQGQDRLARCRARRRRLGHRAGAGHAARRP